MHIGTPKTGTTALQKFLADNGDELRKRGFCYPNLHKDMTMLEGKPSGAFPMNGYLIKNYMVEKWPQWKSDLLWKIIMKYLQHYHVIISYEGLWSYPDLVFEEVMKELRSRYDNIKIIVYLRRQDLYIESIWNQHIKGGMFGEDVLGYYKQKEEDYEYKKRVDFLSDIFGKENVSVRVYEKGQFAGTRQDITSDFLETCGIESNWEKVILPGYINERIEEDVLFLKQQFNREVVSINENDEILLPLKRLVKKHFVNAKIANEGEKKGYLTKEERKELLDKYSEDNEYIAREYLGREDGILFRDMNIDIPYYKAEFSAREKEIIKLFATVVEAEMVELQTLQKKKNSGVKSELAERLRMNLNFRKIKV